MHIAHKFEYPSGKLARLRRFGGGGNAKCVRKDRHMQKETCE